MEILLIIAIIAICLIVKSNKKKAKLKRDQQRDEYFKNAVKTFTTSVCDDGSRDKSLEEDYDAYMEKWWKDHDEYHKCDSTEKNKILRSLANDIPKLKNDYEVALEKLVELSPNNTVFFTTSEESSQWRKNLDALEWNDKISEDIIKTLPALAGFLEIERTLIDIKEYLYITFSAQEYFWAFPKNADPNDEAAEGKFKSCAEKCFASRNYYIGAEGWEIIKKQQPMYDNEEDKAAFMKIMDEDKESENKWIDMWVEKYKKLSIEKYHWDEFSNLVEFFDKIKKKYGHLKWIESPSIWGFNNSADSSFSIRSLKKEPKEEFMRIRELYISGKINGGYEKWKDPKYKEQYEEQ